jgi:hypothetical protein
MDGSVCPEKLRADHDLPDEFIFLVPVSQLESGSLRVDH